MIRKTICLLLSLILLLPLFSSLAAADGMRYIQKSGDFYYELLDDGTVMITGYAGKKDKVAVPDKIKKKTVTVIGSGAFWASSGQKAPSQVTLPKTVREICSGAFGGSRITSITIPASVEKIGKHAFGTSDYLTSVTFENGNVQIEGNPFLLSDALAEIHVAPDHPTLEVVDGMLLNKADRCLLCCPALRVQQSDILVFPEGIEIIGEQAVAMNENVKTVILPDSVREVRTGALANCMEMTEIRLSSGLQTIRAGSLSGGFQPALILPEANPYFHVVDGTIYSKDNTEIVYHPASWETDSFVIPDSVTRIGEGAFYGNTNLMSVTIPDGVTEIGPEAFYNCAMSNVALPGGLTYIGDRAFCGCSELTEITIPESVTSFGEGIISYCENLASVNLPYNMTVLPKGTFNYCTALETVDLPDGITEIGDKAFCECLGMTHIELPENVTVIGEQAFYTCNQLQSITLPSALRKIGKQAFWYCSALTEITIPDGVTIIGDSAFSDCTALVTIHVPASVTEIGGYAFNRCTALKNIYVVKGSFADKYFKKGKPKPKYE